VFSKNNILLGTIIVTLLGVIAAFQFDRPTQKYYKFTTDWFSGALPYWNKILGPYRNMPDIHYLEVGVYEGRSAFWMLENILTHKSSKMTLIDVFNGSYEATFRKNLSNSGQTKRIRVMKGRSQVELRKLPLNSFNIIYIDGSHTAKDVYVDSALSWELLKVGGIIIFDDYLWKKNDLPIDWRPQLPIDTFLTAFSEELDLLFKGWHVFVRKKAPSLPGVHSDIGNYSYDWNKKELFDKMGHPANTKLIDEEWALLEELLRRKKHGDLKANPNSEKKYASLKRKLFLPPKRQ